MKRQNATLERKNKERKRERKKIRGENRQKKDGRHKRNTKETK